jgi:hypothetical protein
LWIFPFILGLTGGCSEIEGHPNLDPSLMVPDATTLLNPTPPASAVQLPPGCDTARTWEKDVISDQTGKLVGPINSAQNQGQDVYEIYRNKCIYASSMRSI